MKIITKILILSSLFFIPLAIDAVGGASLSLSTQSGAYQTGQTFNVTVYVNPGSETIDMVRVKINFPADLLEVQAFNFSPAFNFPSGGNSFDNSAGTLSYGAGVAGGTTQAGVFGTITFRAKAAGQATVSLGSDSLVLAAGEDKFNGQQATASFNLNSPSPSKPDDSSEPQKLKETLPEEISPKETPASAASEPEPETVSEAPDQEEIVMLSGENEEEKQSSWSSKKTMAVLAVIILAILGGVIHKLKNKKAADLNCII